MHTFVAYFSFSTKIQNESFLPYLPTSLVIVCALDTDLDFSLHFLQLSFFSQEKKFPNNSCERQLSLLILSKATLQWWKPEAIISGSGSRSFDFCSLLSGIIKINKNSAFDPMERLRFYYLSI